MYSFIKDAIGAGSSRSPTKLKDKYKEAVKNKDARLAMKLVLSELENNIEFSKLMYELVEYFAKNQIPSTYPNIYVNIHKYVSELYPNDKYEECINKVIIISVYNAQLTWGEYLLYSDESQVVYGDLTNYIKENNIKQLDTDTIRKQRDGPYRHIYICMNKLTIECIEHRFGKEKTQMISTF